MDYYESPYMKIYTYIYMYEPVDVYGFCQPGDHLIHVKGASRGQENR